MSKLSSRGSHRSSVARHVYLRTQQHRLRHVKSIVIRNFTPNDDVNFDLSRSPLAMATYFTLHSAHYPEKVLYKSDPVRQSYNPSWEAVLFEPQDYEKYSAIPSFILKLWVRVGQENEAKLGLEKTIKLSSLVYLGTLLNKDGSGYPPNSIIVGMFEGYYSHPSVGGVPCPPRITHALEKLLPPQSLLEVHKSEVQDSYLHHVLLRLLNRQEVLNKTTAGAKLAHNQVETLVKIEEDYFQKRSERELLKMRVAILRKQLAEKEKEEFEERKQLCTLREELDSQESTLTKGLADLKEHKEKYELDHQEFCKKKEMLVRAKRHQLLRQRNMICEAASTFFILDKGDKFTICNVILQNADQLDPVRPQQNRLMLMKDEDTRSLIHA